MQAAASTVVTWLLKTFGMDVLVLLTEGVQSQWRRLFASRNVLVLGAPQTGKSSLVTYLRSGRPYEVVDGEVRPPDPTAAAVIVDKKFAVQKGNWLRLKLDLPGDPDLRAAWTAALREVRPAGIIYMLDGRLEEAALARAIDDAFDNVLAFYEAGTRELVAFHFFVNHADAYGVTPARAREVLARVTALFEQRRADRHPLETLRVAASSTQLSSNRRAWPEVARALHRFAADLIE